MPDPDPIPASKESAPQPIAPVVVTVIGTGTTAAAAPLTTGTVGSTPDHQPNLVVQVVTPVAVIAVRSARAFFQVLAASVTGIQAGLLSSVVTPGDFWHTLHAGVVLASCAAVVCAIQNSAELFTKLAEKFPLWRA